MGARTSYRPLSFERMKIQMPLDNCKVRHLQAPLFLPLGKKVDCREWKEGLPIPALAVVRKERPTQQGP